MEEQFPSMWGDACGERSILATRRVSGFLSFLWGTIDEKPLGTPGMQGEL